jgi:hypothetical protein
MVVISECLVTTAEKMMAYLEKIEAYISECLVTTAEKMMAYLEKTEAYLLSTNARLENVKTERYVD